MKTKRYSSNMLALIKKNKLNNGNKYVRNF